MTADLASMGHGAELLGVAVRAPDSAALLPALLASVDVAAERAGVRHKLLIVRADTPGEPALREGWKVIGLDEHDWPNWREIAARHSGHCAWLACHESFFPVAELWLEACRTHAERGHESYELIKLLGRSEVPRPGPANPDRFARMIGVTVVTPEPEYQELAAEASRRFRLHSGLDVLRIEVNTGQGFDAKLKLPQLIGDRIAVFFDADWWMLRDADVSAIEGIFAAVPDPQAHDPGSFCRVDAVACGLDPRHYCNSGFFVADCGIVSTMRNVFDLADKRRAAKLHEPASTEWPITDTTDQSWLNFQLKMFHIEPTLLPLEWNFYPRAWQWGCVREFPRNVIGLHAAGVPLAGKQAHLREWAAVLSSEVKPLLKTVP